MEIYKKKICELEEQLKISAQEKNVLEKSKLELLEKF
jgi:hypothetical protein